MIYKKKTHILTHISRAYNVHPYTHARYQLTHQEQLQGQYLAQGHLGTIRGEVRFEPATPRLLDGRFTVVY